MRKILLCAAVAALSLSFVPSHAELGNGCQINTAQQDTAATCHYTAKAATANYVAATPNHWTITVVRDNETVVLASSESAQLPSQGIIDPKPNEVVTVTMGPDDAEGFIAGSIGSLSVVETS